MYDERSAVVEQDGDWFVAYTPEVPGANGQGRTREEALRSLGAAVDLVLADRNAEKAHGVRRTG
jgi:predicted RNase H-like HicB family nuclease